MPLREAIRTVASGQNGVGAFIKQCKQLHFNYCDWAGSSQGMNKFIVHELPKFAKQNPQIEIVVSKRPRKHPVIRGSYINGHERSICVRNLEHQQILQKALILRDSDGEKNKRFKKPVTSINESIRGVWSPYHGDVHKI